MKNWSRREEAKRLRDTGMTYKEVGAAMGVSASYARVLVEQKRRREVVDQIRKRNGPPWYEGLDSKTVWELKRRGFESKQDCMIFLADDLPMHRGSVALPGWEEDRSNWRFSEKKLPLGIVNEIRVWLGGSPFVPKPRIATRSELDRARRLLERHGWAVTPPVGDER